MVIYMGSILSEDIINYLEGVNCFKQSTIRIERNITIYFDPFNMEKSPQDGDIVFITHPHFDHFAISDIKKVMKSTGFLVIPKDALEQAEKEGFKNIVIVEPGKDYNVGGIHFNTIPAYNINKEFHNKDCNWIGYIVTINNMNYYVAGDSDFIPEMEQVKADVAFLPVGGTYTMDAVEAAHAANTIKPKIAVPIHYADIIGSVEDAKTFTSLLEASIHGIIVKTEPIPV